MCVPIIDEVSPSPLTRRSRRLVDVTIMRNVDAFATQDTLDAYVASFILPRIVPMRAHRSGLIGDAPIN